jgi:hypothetical protein
VGPAKVISGIGGLLRRFPSEAAPQTLHLAASPIESLIRCSNRIAT